MKRAMTETFVHELRNDQKLSQYHVGFTIFFAKGQEWCDTAGNSVTDTQKLDALANVSRTGGHFRQQGSCLFYKQVQEFDVVVEANFPKLPRTATRDRYIRDLNECVRHSVASFRSNHDTLTGLSNKDKFAEQLRIEVEILSTANTEREMLSPQVNVAVLALDIDHFKQVNDTFGHLYGDLVLRVFAQRLQNYAEKIMNTNPSIRASVGRPGGEEFSAVISGNVSDKQIAEYCEGFRSCISGDELPTEVELKYSGIAELAQGVIIPPMPDRHVSVSIGMTSIGTLTKRNDIETTCKELLRQADLALFRAKANGRNAVCSFRDILNASGRVLQHHSKVNLVSIDIGTQVGVRIGQEFMVYHPEFFGKSPFVTNDGRTKRKIGVLPKVASGKLVVIDTQAEIAFCRVLEGPPTGEFEPNCILESIPLGSIAHILESDPRLAAGLDRDLSLTAPEVLKSQLVSAAEEKQKIFVAVIRVAELPELLDKYGSHFVNRALASLYRSLKSVVNMGCSLSQIQTTEFAIFSANHNEQYLDDIEHAMDAAVNNAKEETSGKVSFIVGFYRSATDAEIKAGNTNAFDESKGLELARFAASDDAHHDSPNKARFELDLVASTLNFMRTSKRGLEVISNYRFLTEVKVVSPNIENLAGICYYESGSFELAGECFQKAVELAPSNPTLHANLAITQFILGNRTDAFTSFMNAFGVSSSFKLPPGYLGVYALSSAHVFNAGLNEVTREQVIARIESALGNPRESLGYGATEDELRLTLAEMT